jgi:hypothetical protein
MCDASVEQVDAGGIEGFNFGAQLGKVAGQN